MIAQKMDLLALHDIVIASALPKPMPTLAALEAAGGTSREVCDGMSWDPPNKIDRESVPSNAL
jgi:hypothetical protein